MESSKISVYLCIENKGNKGELKHLSTEESQVYESRQIIIKSDNLELFEY